MPAHRPRNERTPRAILPRHRPEHIDRGWFVGLRRSFSGVPHEQRPGSAAEFVPDRPQKRTHFGRAVAGPDRREVDRIDDDEHGLDGVDSAPQSIPAGRNRVGQRVAIICRRDPKQGFVVAKLDRRETPCVFQHARVPVRLRECVQMLSGRAGHLREPRRPDPVGPLAVATPTTRKLADASISLNTRRAYLGAPARLDAWRGAAQVDDASLAVYLGELFEAGRAPATAALAVAAVRFRAKLAGQPDPAGEATARVLGGFRRTAADRGRGQAAPLRADGLAAIFATAERPRTDGRGVESHTTAHRRGRLDAVIASLLFMGGLRRSEVSALEWRDVSDARDGDGVLLTVRTSKTNQEGDAADVRYLKNGAAKAIRTLRAADADAAPTDRVIGLSPLQIQRRFTAAARAAGIEARVTAHSGRVGLASELTARGASTTEVMLAGLWKTARMVAHYSAGATAERGAVRKYL